MHLPKSYLGPPGPDDAEVDSPDFNQPHRGEASASETIDIGTAAAIDRSFDVVHSPKLIGCITQAFSNLIARQAARHPGTHGFRVGHPTAYRKSFARLADETDAVRLEIPLTRKGLTIHFYFDVVFIRDGNASIQLFFQNAFTPFDVLRALTLARLAVHRLDAASATANVTSQ